MTAVDLLDRARALGQLPAPRQRRLIRESAGASQRDLADALGVHVMTLNRWERGQVRPRAQHVVAYADILRRLEHAVHGREGETAYESPPR